MSNIDIIRAWKDEEYRNSLSEEQRSQLPENPAGMIELSDEDMESLGGGYMQALAGPYATISPVAGTWNLCDENLPQTELCGMTQPTIRPQLTSDFSRDLLSSIGGRFYFRY